MKRIILVSLLSVIVLDMSAQQLHRNQLPSNFGLTKPLDESEMPRSRAEVVFPVRVPKKEAVSVLRPTSYNSWEINGGWELADADTLQVYGGDLFSLDYDTTPWYNATVPGTVLTTLVHQGVWPDPYFGLNNMVIPEDLCRKDWWYRTELTLTDEILSKPQLELLFNGINYKADVWMNGVKLGSISGAFVRGRFDISRIAKTVNVLAVHIYPPHNPGIPHEQSAVSGRGPNGGQLCLDGPTFISSEGWDWVPGVRDRNIGIWQDVQLVASGGITIGDTQVVTDLPLPDTSYADVLVETSAINNLDRDAVVTLRAEVDGYAMERSVVIPAGTEKKVVLGPVRMEAPELWMPNGYGGQHLYELSLTAENEGRSLDAQKIKFGVREFSYELTVDSEAEKNMRICFSPTDVRGEGDIFNNRMLRSVGEGVEIPSLRDGVELQDLERLEDDGMSPYMVIRCNGVRIYCKGGNWGMDDMMKNTSREHLEPYFMLHKEAGFTMIRNWTGESTEESFYALADEYGLLVWNDFWMSTEGYNLEPGDDNLFMSNALDVVRRFRNHPSIAVWCPRNEGYAPENLEKELSGMLASEDGTRYYSPNSRYCNLRPSGPWHYFTNAAEYYTDRAFGFNTEIGSPSVPTARTMRKFMAVEDLWPIGDAWHYHDLHPETKTYVSKVSEMYGTATDLDDFCKKVQLMNYDSYRAMFESWNSRLWNNTSGVLLWMSHPAWPSVEWQSYSYDYETFGSWFGSKKACEPLHVQMNLHNHEVVVINNTLEDVRDLKVKLLCRNLNGRKLYSTSKKLDVASANAYTSVFQSELPAYDGVFIVRLILSDASGETVSINDYMLDGTGRQDFRALNELSEVKLNAVVKKRKDMLSVKVSNPSKTLAVGIKLNLENAVSGKQVLPAVFSDGYFNLYPGESRTLTVTYDCEQPVKLSAEGYNVNPVLK